MPAELAPKVEPALLGLVGPFTNIARTMSAQWHIQIVADGTRCETDGAVIRIPFTADYLGAGHRQVLHGLLDHEICHVTEEREAKEAGRVTPLELFHHETNRTIKMLFNVFEDIRIETKWERRYPGVAENLRACNEHTFRRIREKPELIGNGWVKVGTAIICQARGFDTSWCADLAPVLARISAEIEMSKLIEHASDAHALAAKAYEKLRDLVTEDAAGEGATGEGGDGESEGAGVELVQCAPGEGDVGLVKGDRDGKGESDDDAGGASTPAESPVADLLDVLRDDLERTVCKDAVTHKRYIPNPAIRKDDRWFYPEPRDAAAALDNYRQSYEEVRAQVAVMKAKQLAYLQTIARRRVVTGLEAGDIDGSMLYSARVGERRIHSDVVRGRTVNTAICVLLDLSGSMGSGDHPSCAAYYCKRTAIALAEAWEPLHIPSMFFGFDNNHARTTIRPDSGDVFTWRAPFDYHVFKHWHEPLARCRKRFTMIHGYHDNADGEAVFAAACQLAARRERRKLLIVISDGTPCHASIAERTLELHLRQTIRQITRAGIEVLGVGAGTDAPAHYYNRETGASSIVVKDLGRLAAELFSNLKTRLASARTA